MDVPPLCPAKTNELKQKATYYLPFSVKPEQQF